MKEQPVAAFAYNLFAVSNADLERLRALHRSYFRELRAIVANSQPAEAVALVTMSLVELGSAAPSPDERTRDRASSVE